MPWTAAQRSKIRLSQASHHRGPGKEVCLNFFASVLPHEPQLRGARTLGAESLLPWSAVQRAKRFLQEMRPRTMWQATTVRRFFDVCKHRGPKPPAGRTVRRRPREEVILHFWKAKYPQSFSLETCWAQLLAANFFKSRDPKFCERFVLRKLEES